MMTVDAVRKKGSAIRYQMVKRMYGMTEHVHEWGPWHPWCSTYRCIHPGCYKNMPSAEVAKRLNATERLRAGIDELMDAAKDDPNEMGGPFVSLSWVANILEGK